MGGNKVRKFFWRAWLCIN